MFYTPGIAVQRRQIDRGPRRCDEVQGAQYPVAKRKCLFYNMSDKSERFDGCSAAVRNVIGENRYRSIFYARNHGTQILHKPLAV